MIETVPRLLADRPRSPSEALGWVWAWFWVLLYGLGAPAIPICLALQAFRVRQTLDGTVLTVRGYCRTRSVDLAVARVRGEVTDSALEDGQADVFLVAAGPDGGPQVRLALGDSGAILPGRQLAALADAVAAGGTEDPGRRLVVDRLRRHVAQPFAVPRYLWADPEPLPVRPRGDAGP